MPEGDTVWQAAHRLHAALAHRTLIRSELRVPAHATADLTGRIVLDVSARGKHLLTRVEGGLTLHSHLGMDGSWKVYAPGERWRGGPGHQIRAVLGTAEPSGSSGAAAGQAGRTATRTAGRPPGPAAGPPAGLTAVGYRLPVLELLRTADEQRAVGHLGPDLLGADWDPAVAVARLRAYPARPLGEALLDQRNLAGIGNVYKSELCFLAGVTPWLPVGELPEGAVVRLVHTAKRLLEANRRNPARTTTGRRRSDRLFVYGRAPRPCLRCGTSVRVADQDRESPQGRRPTYWCPACQAGPVPA